MSDSPALAILLPQAGNSMEEGTILSWRVKPGDEIKVGDVLYEMETDKATIEVEAEVSGRLARIVVGEGETAPVKTPVAYVGSDAAVEALLGGGTPAVVSTPAPSVIETVSRRKVSPAARKCASDLGVDVTLIAVGSGPDGRILREDVEKAAKGAPKPVVQPVVAAPVPVAVVPVRPSSTSGGVRTPMSKMRRAIAKNLATSKQTLPHWYTKVTIDAEAMLGFLKQEKALYPCSVNDLIVLAVSRVVMELPAYRTQIDGDDLIEFPNANIGIAVGTDEGLTVPVVKGADTRNLKGIAQETRRVIENARNGKLEGVGEAVFSISNLGMHGVEEFVAIINPPESGILSVGSIREEVVVKNGALKAGKVMTMVLSADHRIIDGTMAAKFVVRLKELLENPALL